MIMKNRLAVLLLTPFILCSCTVDIGSNVDPEPAKEKNIITKEIFDYECNPDTVVFKSNYRVEHFFNGVSEVVTEFDNGKAVSNNQYYYNNVNLGDTVETTYYSSGGPVVTVRTKEEFYNYWFGGFGFFFDFEFEDFIYDEENDYYALKEPTSARGYQIDSGYMRTKNNKPVEYSFEIRHSGTFTGVFSRFGEISITLPE